MRAVYLQKRGQNVGSVRGEYRLSTDLGARRHAVALLVHEELSLRSGYGFTPVRVTHVPSTANERTTHWLRESFKFFPRSLALRTAHLARACCARDKCVVCAYPSLPQFYCPMSTQNWRGPYRVSTCSALTTHVVRTDFCSIYKRDFWRTSEGRSIYPPPPDIGRKNSRSSHFHALTTCEWVRTPYTWAARVSTASVR